VPWTDLKDRTGNKGLGCFGKGERTAQSIFLFPTPEEKEKPDQGQQDDDHAANGVPAAKEFRDSVPHGLFSFAKKDSVGTTRESSNLSRPQQLGPDVGRQLRLRFEECSTLPWGGFQAIVPEIILFPLKIRQNLGLSGELCFWVILRSSSGLSRPCHDGSFPCSHPRRFLRTPTVPKV
jgi:hypothetical protein